MNIRKWMAIMLLTSVLGVGCTSEEQHGLRNPSIHGELADTFSDHERQVAMYTEPKSYFSAPAEVTVEVKNTGPATLFFGLPYQVEKREEGVWYSIPFQPNTAFADIGIVVEPGEKYEQKINLKLLDDPDAAGDYRVIKTFYANEKEIILASTFTIVEPKKE